MYINNPRKYIRNLDELPFPDKNLFYNKIPLLQESYMIMTSRGCPFNCTYCSNNMFQKLYSNEINHLRRRSPKNVIKELKWAKTNWNIKLISFKDDVFTASKPWLEEFIPLYKSEINIPFVCWVHPNSMSQEIAQLLKFGGCSQISMGVQSGSERIRKEIFNRYGNNKRILESIKCVKDANIKIALDNIFGAPTEIREDLQKGLYFYKKAKPDQINTYWLDYYPNTKIIDIAKDKNCISEKEICRFNKGSILSTSKEGYGIRGKKRKMYLKYKLLFQLITLFNNDLIYKFISKMACYLPFRPTIVRIVVLINAIKNKDLKACYLIRYAWTRKKIP